MDFFAQQDLRRKRTRLLFALMSFSVLLLIFFVYLGLNFLQQLQFPHFFSNHSKPWIWWNPRLFFGTTLGILCVVGFGTWFKLRQLRRGGRYLVERLEGTPVHPPFRNEKERILWNVVEEMSIASGLPMPDVFILEDAPGINAFAAGLSIYDSAIAVSKGSLRILTRDELQALVAHEFSHILNGDMKMNARLLGWLHGIQSVGLLGLILLRASSFGRFRRLDPRSWLIGPFLIALGSLGVFCGRLIKRAISREREYLADAASVQFTRNPSGILGLLKKIGGFRWGSQIRHPNVEEMSHMYFSSAFRRLEGSLLSTHPPLLDRIRSIEPSFDGQYPEIAKDEALPEFPTKISRHYSAIDSNVDFLTTITPEHIAFAGAFVAELSPETRKQTQEAHFAMALPCALLLDEEESIRAQQKKILHEEWGHDFLQNVDIMKKTYDGLSEKGRLPLLTLALPSLKALSEKKKSQLIRTLKKLVDADEKMSLFEFVLGRMFKNHILQGATLDRTPMIQYMALRPLLTDCAKIFSVLAHAGAEGNSKLAQKAFERGVQSLTRSSLPFFKKEEVSYSALNRILDRLFRASPILKKRILKSCSIIVFFDQKVSVDEGELLRVIADSMGTPMPPILETPPFKDI